VMRRSRGQ